MMNIDGARLGMVLPRALRGVVAGRLLSPKLEARGDGNTSPHMADPGSITVPIRAAEMEMPALLRRHERGGHGIDRHVYNGARSRIAADLPARRRGGRQGVTRKMDPMFLACIVAAVAVVGTVTMVMRNRRARGGQNKK